MVHNIEDLRIKLEDLFTEGLYFFIVFQNWKILRVGSLYQQVGAQATSGEEGLLMEPPDRATASAQHPPHGSELIFGTGPEMYKPSAYLVCTDIPTLKCVLETVMFLLVMQFAPILVNQSPLVEP